MGARPNFASKDVQNYFLKDFHARKYFWVFVKERKVLEKFLACMGVLENSNMQWKKSKKIKKIKMMEGDYEIRTDLPSAGLAV